MTLHQQHLIQQSSHCVRHTFLCTNSMARQNFELLPKNTRNAMRVRYLEKQILSASLAAVKKVEGTLGRITEKEMEEQQKRQEMQKAGMWQRIGIAFQPRTISPLEG